MALFESYERREKQILAVIKEYGINSIEECADVCKAKGLDIYKLVEGIQPICFENAKWAYTVGCAIAIKKGCTKAADAAAAIGEGLQAFCIPGSVADQRKVGLGHGNLGKMLLEEDTECFAFLAGHESFAAAEGAIGIAEKANKVRQKPLRVILNGLGKDAAQIIARINGFTYVETEMDYATGEVKEVFRKAYSDGLRAKVNCYGANDVREGVAIMWKENVDVAQTMSARALQSCGRKMLTFPSPVTPQTRHASSIRSQAPTRRSAPMQARSTSLLHPAAVQAVPCIRITWQQVLLPTA